MKETIMTRFNHAIMETPNGRLYNKGNTVEKTSQKLWTCNTRGLIGWSEGIHVWRVTLETDSALSVGICKGDIHPTDCRKNNDKRIDIYCGSGDVIVGNEIVIERLLPGPLKKGSILVFMLDFDRRTLHVSLDGKWVVTPVASNLGEGPWYPYLCLERKGTAVSLRYL